MHNPGEVDMAFRVEGEEAGYNRQWASCLLWQTEKVRRTQK
jgi:hypothetical protein